MALIEMENIKKDYFLGRLWCMPFKGSTCT